MVESMMYVDVYEPFAVAALLPLSANSVRRYVATEFSVRHYKELTCRVADNTSCVWRLEKAVRLFGGCGLRVRTE